MEKDYLQLALHTFNKGKSQWYLWKKEDAQGNKIPNNERMKYENLILINNDATMPSKAEVDAKIEELKQAEVDREARKASAKAKLEALGLTTEEIKDTFGL